MSKETKIQWCDSAVNPIMGCGGCELFPAGRDVLATIDGALASAGVSKASSKPLFRKLIDGAYSRIPAPEKHHHKAVTTTNIWHFRKEFQALVEEQHGSGAATAAEAAIERSVTCYAAKLHLNKGYSLKPKDDGEPRRPNPGYAPTFEEVTRYEGRVAEAAAWPDLLGTEDPDRPWINGLPRLIFVSDMGDALSRKTDFSWLKPEVIEPIRSPDGKRHLWLWLTKRPDRMAELADEIGGLPDNVCAMTTVAGPDALERIDQLRSVDAKVRGLSLEPLWEEIPPHLLDLDGVDWVIAGGESGSAEFVRPFPVEWAESKRDYCQKKGVAFLLKQLGSSPTRGGTEIHLSDTHGGNWEEWVEDLKTREFPGYFRSYRDAERPSVAGPRRPLKGGLTRGERDDFKRLDKVVERAAKSFVDAAAALHEIRERKLYRGRFKRFEDYCQSVHKISRQYANKLIKAGRTYVEMETIVSKRNLPEPKNEAQLRELGRLGDRVQREEVYIEAVEVSRKEERPVTARHIKDAIEKRGKITRPTPAPGSSPAARLRSARKVLSDLEAEIEEGRDPARLLRKLRKLLGP